MNICRFDPIPFVDFTTFDCPSCGERVFGGRPHPAFDESDCGATEDYTKENGEKLKEKK